MPTDGSRTAGATSCRPPLRYCGCMRVRRRGAVRQHHDRHGGRRSAGRTQPGLLRSVEQPAAPHCRGCRDRIRRPSATFPSSISRTRSLTSGGDRPSAGRTTTSNGSARGSRSTSPSCMPRSDAGSRSSRRAPPHATLGDVAVRSGRRLSRLSSRAHQRRQPGLSGRSSTTRVRRFSTCCAA